MQRKNFFSNLSAGLLAVGILTACHHTDDSFEDVSLLPPHLSDGNVSSASLVITTRATTETAEIGFPVYVYLFKDGTCHRRETINDADYALTMQIPEGNYSLYAVSGADGTRYVLPDVETALPTSVLAPRSGQTHGDLQVATYGSIPIKDGDKKEVPLALQRKVMLVEKVVIEHVPKDVTALSLEISPLYAAVALNGEYVDGTNASYDIPLTSDSERTWRAQQATYLLPVSANPATLTVYMTREGEKRGYIYSCSQALDANHKIRIHGTYTELDGVTLTGTITGSEWGEDIEIDFNFDDSGSAPSESEDPENGPNAGDDEEDDDNDDDDDDGDDEKDPTPGVTELPNVGDIYMGCYVLAHTSNGTAVTLLAPQEDAEVFKELEFNTNSNEKCTAAVAASLLNWPQEISTEWRTPSKSEAEIISSGYETINNAFSEQSIEFSLSKSRKYLYRDANGFLYTFQVGTTPGTGSRSTSDHLIAVADVKISAQ